MFMVKLGSHHLRELVLDQNFLKVSLHLAPAGARVGVVSAAPGGSAALSSAPRC